MVAKSVTLWFSSIQSLTTGIFIIVMPHYVAIFLIIYLIFALSFNTTRLQFKAFRIT